MADRADPDPMDAQEAASPVRPAATVRWRPTPFSFLIVVLLVAGGWAASSWWASGCRDGYCTGSRHHVTVQVRPYVRGDCLNNVDPLKTGSRYWFSYDHAPEEWGSGRVAGTLVVTDTSFDSPGAWTRRAATFTADQGGSIVFVGGTSNSFSDLSCPVS